VFDAVDEGPLPCALRMPAASTHEVITFLDQLLEPERFDDYGPNGLQVPGGAGVTTVVTGVSAHVALFERAAEEGADLVLVHHGLFWRGMPMEVTPSLHRRLAPLFRHGMALAAYHLPLDGHPEHGNNALLAEGLGCDTTEPFAMHHGVPIGVAGTFAGDGITIAELTDRVTMLTDREPLVLPEGPERIRRIGIVSGAGADYVLDAVAGDMDAFLTGEPAERIAAVAREEQIHFVAAGHHATETFGVKRLGDLLAREHQIVHRFIDIPNPI
jgi:dinuclear metal center YbgI/SA1388 family protein